MVGTNTTFRCVPWDKLIQLAKAADRVTRFQLEDGYWVSVKICVDEEVSLDFMSEIVLNEKDFPYDGNIKLARHI